MKKKLFKLLISLSVIYSNDIFASEGVDEKYFNLDALVLTDEQRSGINEKNLSNISDWVPGTYRVKILINELFHSEENIDFIICDGELCPVITKDKLKEFKVDTSAIIKTAKEDDYKNIFKIIPGASAHLNENYNELKISIPQAFLENTYKDDISPELWDEGLPVFFSSYDIFNTNVSSNEFRRNESSIFLNTRNGANLGAWRLRNYTYINNSSSTSQLYSPRTWLERDVRSLRSRIVIGEQSTPGMTFESTGFNGLSISSKDEMLSNSQQGYAPEIRGVALTNAIVEVYQDNNLLYQTVVSSGNFLIKDLIPVITSGELTILIKEENGTVRKFTQAYASTPISVRKGAFKYSLSVGESIQKGYSTILNQKFIQAELLYGVLYGTTVYGGSTISNYYQSQMLGVGQGLGNFGAISIDVINAASEYSDGKIKKGIAWQTKYSKNFDSTGTSLSLLEYRYANRSFQTFDDSISNHFNTDSEHQRGIKKRLQATVMQPTESLGSIYINAFKKTYWRESADSSVSLSAGWSNSFNGIGLNLNFLQDRMIGTGKKNYVSSLSINIPLNKFLSPNSNNSLLISNSYTQDSGKNNSLNTSLSGTAMSNNQLSWHASQSRNTNPEWGRSLSSSIGGNYIGNEFITGVNYSNYQGQQSALTLNLRGAILMHQYGMSLSRPLSEGSGYALVRAENAEGLGFYNQQGVGTNSKGVAILPSLTPYRENEILIDTTNAKDNVDVIDVSKKFIPQREALVLAKFRTRIGYRVYAHLNYHGKAIPFGSVVATSNFGSWVNENGSVFLSGVTDNEKITVTLSNSLKCSSIFKVDSSTTKNGIMLTNLECK